MHRKLLAAALLSAALAFLTTPAAAGKGCAIGGYVGASAAHSEVSVAGANDDGSVISGLIAASATCDFAFNQVAGMFVGVGIDGSLYRRQDNHQPILFGATGTAPEARAATVLRLGYNTSAFASVYVEGGRGWGWDKDLIVGPGASLGMPTAKGWVLGGGVETHLTGHVYMDLKYRAFFAEGQDIAVAPGLALSREPQDHTVMIGLKWEFGAPPAAVKPLK